MSSVFSVVNPGVALPVLTLLSVVGCGAGAVSQEAEVARASSDLAILEARLDRLNARIADMEAAAKPGHPPAGEREARAKSLAAALAAEGLYAELRERGVAVRLPNSLLFAPGETALARTAAKPLAELARALAQHAPAWRIRVEGHTDSSRPRRVADRYPTNWELSAARALAVRRFLVEEGGLEPAPVHAAACAEFRPVADESAREGVEMNRRVEVVLVPE